MCPLKLFFSYFQWQWVTGDPLSFQLWLTKDYRTQSISTTQICFYKGRIRAPFRNVGTVTDIQNLTENVYLKLQRINSCTIMYLANLAYPEWITVNCDKKHYTDIVCMQNNNIITVTLNILYQPMDNYCANQDIIKDQYCYQFVYFD